MQTAMQHRTYSFGPVLFHIQILSSVSVSLFNLLNISQLHSLCLSLPPLSPILQPPPHLVTLWQWL
jgi:hypothetical protein